MALLTLNMKFYISTNLLAQDGIAPCILDRCEALGESDSIVHRDQELCKCKGWDDGKWIMKKQYSYSLSSLLHFDKQNTNHDNDPCPQIGFWKRSRSDNSFASPCKKVLVAILLTKSEAVRILPLPNLAQTSVLYSVLIAFWSYTKFTHHTLTHHAYRFSSSRRNSYALSRCAKSWSDDNGVFSFFSTSGSWQLDEMCRSKSFNFTYLNGRECIRLHGYLRPDLKYKTKFA